MEDLTLATKELDGRLDAIKSQFDSEAADRERLVERLKKSDETLGHLRDLYRQYLTIREGLRP